MERFLKLLLNKKNENLLVRYMLCKADKREGKRISGSYKHTTNFRMRVKVSIYLIFILYIFAFRNVCHSL